MHSIGEFLPYLPDGGESAAESLLYTMSDLETAMTADAGDLWALVRADESLITFLESYLRYATRPYDDGFPDLSPLDHALWHHVATLLARLYVIYIYIVYIGSSSTHILILSLDFSRAFERLSPSTQVRREGPSHAGPWRQSSSSF